MEVVRRIRPARAGDPVRNRTFRPIDADRRRGRARPPRCPHAERRESIRWWRSGPSETTDSCETCFGEIVHEAPSSGSLNGRCASHSLRHGPSEMGSTGCSACREVCRPDRFNHDPNPAMSGRPFVHPAARAAAAGPWHITTCVTRLSRAVRAGSASVKCAKAAAARRGIPVARPPQLHRTAYGRSNRVGSPGAERAT